MAIEYPIKKHDWVCLDCRRSLRRSPFGDEDVRCSECGELCEDIGSKWRVPKRADVAAWDELATMVDEHRPLAIARMEAVVVNRPNIRPGRTSVQRTQQLRHQQDQHLRRLRDIETRRQSVTADQPHQIRDRARPKRPGSDAKR